MFRVTNRIARYSLSSPKKYKFNGHTIFGIYAGSTFLTTFGYFVSKETKERRGVHDLGTTIEVAWGSMALATAAVVLIPFVALASPFIVLNNKDIRRQDT